MSEPLTLRRYLGLLYRASLVGMLATAPIMLMYILEANSLNEAIAAPMPADLRAKRERGNGVRLMVARGLMMGQQTDPFFVNAYVTDIAPVISFISPQDVEGIATAILSAKRCDHHRPVIRMYALWLNAIPPNTKSRFKPEDVAMIYANLTWLARDHGRGIDPGAGRDEIDQWFEDAQRYCDMFCKSEVAHMYFEHAVFFEFTKRPAESFNAVMSGIDRIGHNSDKDGSLYHLMGQMRFKQAAETEDVHCFQEAIRCFNEAIRLKTLAKNETTPFFARSMILQAQLHIAGKTKDKGGFREIAQSYEVLITDWNAALGKFDEAGLRVLPEVYSNSGMALFLSGERDRARERFIEARTLTGKYDARNRPALDVLTKLIESTE